MHIKFRLQRNFFAHLFQLQVLKSFILWLWVILLTQFSNFHRVQIILIGFHHRLFKFKKMLNLSCLNSYLGLKSLSRVVIQVQFGNLTLFSFVFVLHFTMRLLEYNHLFSFKHTWEILYKIHFKCFRQDDQYEHNLNNFLLCLVKTLLWVLLWLKA